MVVWGPGLAGGGGVWQGSGQSGRMAVGFRVGMSAGIYRIVDRDTVSLLLHGLRLISRPLLSLDIRGLLD